MRNSQEHDYWVDYVKLSRLIVDQKSSKNVFKSNRICYDHIALDQPLSGISQRNVMELINRDNKEICNQNVNLHFLVFC